MTAALTEDVFISRASAFLTNRLGDGARFDADTDLVGTGVLDSLTMLEFFFFIEEQRGAPIDTKDFSLQQISSIRTAYRLAAANAPGAPGTARAASPTRRDG
jgi:acyl carrier protein